MSGVIKPKDRPGWRPVKRNCHTCGWDAGASCYVPGPREDVGEWLEQHDAMADASGRPISTADGCPGWKPKPGAENTDRAQVAALGDESVVDDLMRRAGVGGVPDADEIPTRSGPWNAAAIQSEIDRIEAELNEKAARELRATANVGWRGHLPIAGRGPGHTTAMRLRRAGMKVRARKVRR